MYADIIIISKQPKKLFFTYEIPKDCTENYQVGNMVKVEFRKSIKVGLVIKIYNISKSFKYKLKPILDFYINSNIIFPNFLIKTILNTSTYYMISPGSFLYALFPQILKKELPTIEENSNCSDKERIPSIPSIKKEYIEDFKRVIEDLDNNKVNIIQYFCQNKINSLYKVIIQKAIDKNEQILLLFPTHQMAKHYFSILNNEFYNKVTYYDSTKNKTSRWQEINKLSQNETGIIIGTKLSLFLPFKNLKKIVVVDYESEHYIQDDQTPRYNLIHLVKDLKKNNNDIRTIFSTNLPLVNDVLEKNKIIRLSLNYPTPPVVLNMNDELKEAKHYFLSFPLIENIKDCINKKQKLILFSNKKGFSNTIICRDCNHIFKCPKCSFNLSFDTQKTICKKCNFSQNIISFCNNCHGNNIKQIAFGTKKLKNIMDIEFPDLKTICLDSDFEKDNDNLLNNYDCYIVTQYYLDNYYELPIHNIGLISIVHLDSILNQPSYNTQERAYSLIMNMYSLAISKNAKFILQTFLYDNYVMSSFRSQDLKYYYKNELQNRKDFNYPPYGELIYLINKGENENTTLNEANSILQKLIKEFDSNENILIIGPNQNTKQHNKYIFSIIIKILNKDSYNGFSNKINMILPPKWIIHINPNKPLNLVN